MNFGLNLKLARTAAGMTQTELADKLGIAQKQLSRYERGIQVPSVAIAVEMADALGVDMNTLTKKSILGDK
jgi:transcriptional regulator with XRE-family HTH domain